VNHDRTLTTRSQLTAVASLGLLALLVDSGTLGSGGSLLLKNGLLLGLVTLHLSLTGLSTAVLKVELLGKLEVELNGGTLELTLESV